MKWRAVTNWIIVGCLAATGFGCFGAQIEQSEFSSWEGAVEDRSDLSALPARQAGAADTAQAAVPLPSPALPLPSPVEASEPVGEPERPTSPVGALAPEIEQVLEDTLKAAKRRFKAGELATAAILLEQALQLDPTSNAARDLQRRVEKVQRRAEEKARSKRVEQELKNILRAAKRTLKAGELATAAILLEQALQLDPISNAARNLQRRVEKAQHRTEEKARRNLISLYQRKGSKVLASGDVDRALIYFQAAQELDPTDHKIFKRIQSAHETAYRLKAKLRQQTFNERVRLAKSGEHAPLQEPPVVGNLTARVAAITATPAEEPSVTFQPVASATMAPPAPTPQPSQASVQEPETVPVAQADVALEEPPAVPGEPDSVAAAWSPGVGEYTVQPEDVLEITVFEEPHLTTVVRVKSGGEITFPLLGRVTVAGLAVTKVGERLTKLLAEDFLVNPQVQVFIQTYHTRKVFVTGSVNAPGAYPLPTEQPTTIMETIAMAGGFSEDAAPNGTRIIRVENGQEKTIRVRADDIIKKGNKSQDMAVLPNDIIFVPESFF